MHIDRGTKGHLHPSLAGWKREIVIAGGIIMLAILPIRARVASWLGSDETAQLPIVVLDNTRENPLLNPVIQVPGYGDPWVVKFQEAGVAAASFQSFPIDKPHTFMLTPDGQGGAAIEIEFQMNTDVESGSPTSAVVLDIRDDEVIVSGPAIATSEHRYAR